MPKACSVCSKMSDEVEWVRRKGQLTGLTCRPCYNAKANSRNKRLRSTEEGAQELKLQSKLANERFRAKPGGKAKMQASATTYYNKRLKQDALFKLSVRLRTVVHTGLANQGYNKTSRTHEILGASFEEVMQHLNCPNGIPEGYELDHILPMALAYDEASAIKLNHYTNLQLLTKAANLEKRDKLPDGRNARDLSVKEKKELGP